MATSTTSSTSTTTPPGGPLTRLLELRRDGIHADNGVRLLNGVATLAAWRQLLGEPDQVVSHLPVPGSTTCTDENGRERLSLDANQTVRWGDLRVVFADRRIMVGYLYGPRVDARPIARFRGLTVGERIGDLLADRAVDLESTPNPTHGFLFREVGDGPRVRGFASGTTEDATIEQIFTGYQCFGLAR
jgi:hypothetical protein